MANPNPIVAGLCGGCGQGSTDREATTDLTIKEDTNKACTFNSIGMVLTENGSGAVIASGSFDGSAVSFFTGTTSLPASGGLVANAVGVHYAASFAGRAATLRYTVTITDNNSQQTRTLTLAVQVTT